MTLYTSSHTDILVSNKEIRKQGGYQMTQKHITQKKKPWVEGNFHLLADRADPQSNFVLSFSPRYFLGWVWRDKVSEAGLRGNRCWMGTGFQNPGIDWEKQKQKQEKWLELWKTNNKKSNTSEEHADQFIQEQHWKLDSTGMGITPLTSMDGKYIISH